MKKYILDLIVTDNIHLHNHYVLLKATSHTPLPEAKPGQFAEVRIDNSSATFLRRPISVNFFDKEKNEVWFLVQLVGNGTRKLSNLKKGDTLNIVYPLGNGFSEPRSLADKLLLIGGGIGSAPMLYLAAKLFDAGYRPSILLGVKNKQDLLQANDFLQYGKLYVTTEDGSLGEKGYVTQHSLLQKERFDYIYCCGPKPMMVAVAKYASNKDIACEVSLENHMACGVGACLCCVEKTIEGHMCVCKEGPVFNIKKLLWQI